MDICCVCGGCAMVNLETNLRRWIKWACLASTMASLAEGLAQPPNDLGWNYSSCRFIIDCDSGHFSLVVPSNSGKHSGLERESPRRCVPVAASPIEPHNLCRSQS